MIFLVSTDNPRYGFSKWNASDYFVEVHEGDPCFIVTVTVRNDYTTDPLWDDGDSPSNMYNKFVTLTVYLYNQQGRVDAVDVKSLYGYVYSIEPGETDPIDMYLATDRKDIERYKIYVTYVGPMPEP